MNLSNSADLLTLFYDYINQTLQLRIDPKGCFSYCERYQCLCAFVRWCRDNFVQPGNRWQRQIVDGAKAA